MFSRKHTEVFSILGSKHNGFFIFLSLFAFDQCLDAVDSLGVGFRSGGVPRWNQAVTEARFLAIAADSIWTWDIEPNGNLMPGTVDRLGSVFIPGEAGDVATFVEGADVMFDGSDTTAFIPDEFSLKFGLKRNSIIYIDLGATFRVNRIKLYPRQDIEHRALFPRAFRLSTNGGIDDDGLVESGNILGRYFKPVFDFYNSNPNRESVIERRFESRYVRYVRLEVRSTQPWEIAELEVYSDGTSVPGEYVSIPMLADAGTRPLWGQVRYDGGEIDNLPITVQTRAGPDAKPMLHYRFTGIAGDREKVSSSEYVRLDSIEKGPIVPNPEWSSWETVTDGMILSPSIDPYIQFRLLINGPGINIRRLILEYLTPPIASRLDAEITPLVVEAGQQTPFVISLQTQMRIWRSDGSLLPNPDSGFMSMRIVTAAQIDAVDRVLVDDREVDFTARTYPDEGTIIRFRRPVVQDGTFIQIHIRASVFRDATRFDLQASDRRQLEGRYLRTVHQSAREHDVDPVSAGGDLVVRLAGGQGLLPLLANFKASSYVFSPNGDGINDIFQIEYALLKLTAPTVVSFVVYSLDGQMISVGPESIQINGNHTISWNGCDDMGKLIDPGIYIYRVEFNVDGGVVARNGTVGVTY